MAVPQDAFHQMATVLVAIGHLPEVCHDRPRIDSNRELSFFLLQAPKSRLQEVIFVRGGFKPVSR